MGYITWTGSPSACSKAMTPMKTAKGAV
jgi:hypothetical protein